MERWWLYSKERTSEPITIEAWSHLLYMSSGRKEYLLIGKQLKRSSRGIGSRPPEILYILSAVAHFLPEKLTVYTTPVGLLNARNYNFGGECQLRPGSRQLKEALKANLSGRSRRSWSRPETSWRNRSTTSRTAELEGTWRLGLGG